MSLDPREAPSRGSWQARALRLALALRGLTGLEAGLHLSKQVTDERQEVCGLLSLLSLERNWSVESKYTLQYIYKVHPASFACPHPSGGDNGSEKSLRGDRGQPLPALMGKLRPREEGSVASVPPQGSGNGPGLGALASKSRHFLLLYFHPLPATDPILQACCVPSSPSPWLSGWWKARV